MTAVIRRSPAFWRRYFMDVAVRTSLLSKDPDRKVGAVIHTPDRRQMSPGYNGLPPEVADTLALLYNKEEKNRLMRHAEDNAILQCPFPTKGCSLTVTRFPCEMCALKIVNAGIVHLVTPRPDFGHVRWGMSWTKAVTHLHEGGVRVTYMEVGE